MTVSNITPLPAAPSREDAEEIFVQKTNAFLGALPNFSTQINDVVDGVNALTPTVNAALAGSNFQGVYGAGTLYNVGQSVSFNGSIFLKLSDAPAGTEPVAGDDWFLIPVLKSGTGPNEVVQLDGSGALPAVSGANLTGLPAAGLTLLNTTVVTGTPSALDFTGLDDTYDEYFLQLINLKFSNDSRTIYLRTSDGTGFHSGTGGYEALRISHTTASTTPAGAGGLSTSVSLMTTAAGNDANEDGVSGEIRIIKPSAAQYCTFRWSLTYRDPSANLVAVSGVGQRMAAESIVAVRLLPNANNWASGTVRLFGVKNS